MAQESDNQVEQAHGFWRRWRNRILIVFVAALLAGGGWYFFSQRGDEVIEEPRDVLPEVMVRPYGELTFGATIEKIATLESAQGAPLIARSGGRVTALRAQLGDFVQAGSTVVSIDGAREASPARAQLAGATNALASFRAIEAEALASADQAIATAQLVFDAAAAGKPLTTAQVAKSREQADLSVRGAKLTFEDVQGSESSRDALIRSADLSLQAAQLAQDQATLARDLTNRQLRDGVKQAEAGLTTAQQAKEKLRADLTNQRLTLETQVTVANEQVRLAQVTTPVSGQVTQLSVRVGDFVRPGQEVGHVIGFEGAQVLIDVPTGVRDKLRVGQEVELRANGLTFAGEVVRLADAPRTDVALWQIDIFVAGTPEVVHPGELVVVVLPVGSDNDGSAFIPLDAVTVRQSGIVLFTADQSGMVSEHAVTVIDFTSTFVEGAVHIPDDALVIVSGNRTLQSGDHVRISEG